VLVENTLIELANNGGWDEQITVAKGVWNAHIRYNEITNSAVESNGGEGIDFKDGVRDSYIYGNYIHDVTRRAIYVDGGVAEGALTSNIHIFGNYLENIEIVNNTVADANRELWWANIHINHPDVTGVIRNNLSIGGDDRPIRVKGGTTGMLLDNNLCDIEDSRCAIFADPLVSAEFKPLPDSPLIDTGVVEGAPVTDYAGTVRKYKPTSLLKIEQKRLEIWPYQNAILEFA
jgi:hypothetical protein